MGVALDSSGVLVLLMVVMGISAFAGSWWWRWGIAVVVVRMGFVTTQIHGT